MHPARQGLLALACCLALASAVLTNDDLVPSDLDSVVILPPEWGCPFTTVGEIRNRSLAGAFPMEIDCSPWHATPGWRPSFRPPTSAASAIQPSVVQHSATSSATTAPGAGSTAAEWASVLPRIKVYVQDAEVPRQTEPIHFEDVNPVTYESRNPAVPDSCMSWVAGVLVEVDCAERYSTQFNIGAELSRLYHNQYRTWFDDQGGIDGNRFQTDFQSWMGVGRSTHTWITKPFYDVRHASVYRWIDVASEVKTHAALRHVVLCARFPDSYLGSDHAAIVQHVWKHVRLGGAPPSSWTEADPTLEGDLCGRFEFMVPVTIDFSDYTEAVKTQDTLPVQVGRQIVHDALTLTSALTQVDLERGKLTTVTTDLLVQLDLEVRRFRLDLAFAFGTDSDHKDTVCLGFVRYDAGADRFYQDYAGNKYSNSAPNPDEVYRYNCIGFDFKVGVNMGPVMNALLLPEDLLRIRVGIRNQTYLDLTSSQWAAYRPAGKADDNRWVTIEDLSPLPFSYTDKGAYELVAHPVFNVTQEQWAGPDMNVANDVETVDAWIEVSINQDHPDARFYTDIDSANNMRRRKSSRDTDFIHHDYYNVNVFGF